MRASPRRLRRTAILGVILLLCGVLLTTSQAEAEPGVACDHGLQKAADDPDHGPLCSHGPDPVHDAEGEGLFPADSGVSPDAPCIGDGILGYRIEVIYGVPSDLPNNYDASVPVIRNSVAFADSYFEGSDSRTTQHLRWLCENGQEVTVRNVTLAPVGTDGLYTFSDMHSSLIASTGKGRKSTSAFRRTDRIYVVFVDGIDAVYPYCGQGNVDRDDSASSKNRNNSGPAYSLIACWNGTTTLHEIGHNLGAVQLTAPHSSGAYHCYDEFDVMCYNDGGPYFLGPDGQSGTADDQTTQAVCIDPLKLIDAQDKQFDCNLDDYYNPLPTTGSYVATHWNLANSNWVEK